MNKIKLTICGLVFGTSSFSQTTEFEGHIKLGNNDSVFKIITIPGCPHIYNPPVGTSTTTITHETKFKNGSTDITVESIVPPAAPTTVLSNQELKISLAPNSEGEANLYIDEKDKSILHVNYWLNTINIVPARTIIEEWYPVYSCIGIPTMTRRAVRLPTTNEETFYLERVNPTETAKIASTWFMNSEQLHVLNTAGALDYYLVNRFDRNAKYVLELQNRQSIKYNSTSIDFGALTIPFKYRFGFKRNDIKVRDDVIASINLGVYSGYKITKYSIINKAGTYMNKTFFSLRVGSFIDLSSTSLDSISTTVGKEPMKKDDKQNIAVLSTGVAIMGDFSGVQIGIYGGWDLGMGPEAGNWNYNKRFWLGFGAGFKITDLFAKKE